MISIYLVYTYYNNSYPHITNMLETLLDSIDISFKWLLLAFNFLTILFVYLHKRKNPKTRTHPILFILAHPDD